MSDGEINYDVPTSRDTLLSSFNQVDKQVTALWARIAADDFFALPAGEGWSPAGNLVHLVRAVAPVAMALRLPRFVSRLLFGSPAAPSRSFVEIRDT